MLFDQHDVRWIPPGASREQATSPLSTTARGVSYSSIIEIETPMDEDGEYILDDEGRFGPYELAWEYTAETQEGLLLQFYFRGKAIAQRQHVYLRGSNRTLL